MEEVTNTENSLDESNAETGIEAYSETDSADSLQKPESEESEPAEKSVRNKKKSKRNPQGGNPRPRKTTKQLLIGLLIKIAVLALAIWGLFTFVFGITIHYGNNMHPMVRDGDLVISFRPQPPYINAAVMYHHDGKTTVGRVIAMEGSIVNIDKKGTFTVNGNTPSEEVFYPTYPADGSAVKYPYTVPKGKVFILNDFREDTDDSRNFGAVDIGDLDGALLLTMRRRGF